MKEKLSPGICANWFYGAIVDPLVNVIKT